VKEILVLIFFCIALASTWGCTNSNDQTPASAQGIPRNPEPTPPIESSPKLGKNSFSNITDLALGDFSACVIVDGNFRCWGNERSGELTPPTDLGKPMKIFGGFQSFCAATEKGLRCWGKTCNSWSDRCRGEIFIPALINPKATLAHLDQNYCAVDDTGVVCWQLFNKPLFFRIALKDVKQVVLTIAPGGNPIDACAIVGEQSVQCWQFEEGSNYSKFKVIPLSRPKEIAVGYLIGLPTEACVIDDNDVKCWDPFPGSVEKIEISAYTNLKNPHNIVSSQFGSCVLTDEGMRCWHNKRWDQYHVERPVEYPNMFEDLSVFKNPRKLAANSTSICALTDDGVICIGTSDSPINNAIPVGLHSPTKHQ
jgi:hypothetical protein